jgi:hypothetical protein
MAEFAVLQFERLQPHPLVRRQTGARAGVVLRLPDPVAQRLAVQPIFPAIDIIAAHSIACSARCSRIHAIRTARPRTSLENRLFVFF